MKLFLLLATLACATVPSPETKRQYFTCNGSTTAFTFTAPVNSSDDVNVSKIVISTGVPTSLTEGAGYTIVATNSDYLNGGVVTIAPALSDLFQVVIWREIVTSQETASGAINAASIELALDKLTREAYDARYDLDNRALVLPQTGAASFSGEIPNSVTRASKNLGFDSGGNLTVTDDTGTFTSITAVWDDVVSKKPIADVRAFGAAGDGVTDDRQAFQDALDSGYDVYIPYTTTSYIIDGNPRLNIETDGQKVFGSGLIQFKNGAGLNTFFGNPINNFTGTYLQNITLDGLNIQGESADTDVGSAVMMIGVNNLKILNCTIKNFGVMGGTHKRGMELFLNRNATIAGNYIFNVSGGGCTKNYTVGGLTFANNHIEDTGDDGSNCYWDSTAFYDTYNVEEVDVAYTGNTYKNCGIDGGQGLAIAARAVASKNMKITVTGNTIVDQNRRGILIRFPSADGTPTAVGDSEMIVADNIIFNAGKDSSTTVDKRAGISILVGIRSVSVTGNIVMTTGGYGISINGSGGEEIENLVCSNNIVSGAGDIGINLGSVLGGSIIGNSVYNAGDIGMQLSAVVGANIIGNRIFSSVDHGMSLLYLTISGDVKTVCSLNQVIDSGDEGFRIGPKTSDTLENLIFTNNIERNSTGNGIEIVGSGSTLVNCIFTGNSFETASVGDSLISTGTIVKDNIGALLGGIRTDTIEISSSEIKLLFSAPKELVAAQGADTLVEFISAILIHDAGVAYDGIAGTEDLVIQYEDNTAVSKEIEPIGFLDQTSDEIRLVDSVLPTADPVPVGDDLTGNKNDAIQLKMLVGEIGATTGSGTMTIKITYRVHLLGL